MLKILWITPTPRKMIREILKMSSPKDSSGNWIDAAYDQLKGNPYFHIDFASGDKKIRKGKIVTAEKNGVKVYVTHLPYISFGKSGGNKTILSWKKIIDDEKPDVIQLWGCESSVDYDVTLANTKHIPTVIYHQGLVGIHCLYRNGRIEDEAIKPHGFWWKFRCLISKEKQKYYQKQARLEITIIENASYLITDNQFVRNYYQNINPKIAFSEIPLPMKPIFFESRWTYEKCKKETIFTLYGADPNKGLHQLLKAINIVRVFHPNIKVILPGFYPSQISTKRKRNYSLFELWAFKFCKQKHLEKNVVFVGRLTPEQMASQLENANMFVNPSCMETQLGSTREAMVVGCPVISAVCGCVLEMIQHEENGLLYRYEEYQILAAHILHLLDDPQHAIRLAENGRRSMRSFEDSEKQQDSFSALYTRCVPDK